jgi:hypothetical protein
MRSGAKRELVLDTFKTKKEALECLREIRDRYLDGRDLVGDDFAFMSFVLSHHPSVNRKIGAGLSAIFVAVDRAGYGTLGFWVRRTDGSTDDFSWNECLRGSSEIDKIRDAGRNAIRMQISAFRLGARDTCATCGVAASSVDHTPAFSVLIDAWIKSRNGAPETRGATASEGVGARFKYDYDAIAWADYHREHACLQILCGSCNSRKGAR